MHISMSNSNDLYALILAGGVGTRLWPRSRAALPKQMLGLTAERTMLQQTVDRVQALIPPEHIWVMTNAEYVDLVRAQLPELPAANVVGEPAPRGTAPAIGLGAQFIARKQSQGVMFCLHADHYIADEETYRKAMQSAAAVAKEGWLVNLGVTPTRPETGYGYVELGKFLGDFHDQPAHEVVRFREKPDAETAKEYVESGRYLWNSGIFCWRTDVIQAEFTRLLPDIQNCLTRIGDAIGAQDFQTRLWEEWETLKGETTIDRGIMEHAAKVATVPMDVGWNDVGAWDSLASLVSRDEKGNSVTGTGDTIVLDSENTFIYSEEKLVAVVGVQDLIVVDVNDALLVMHQSRAQDVKQVVNELKARGRNDLL
jgi:mannose-1-phosphate guanylyltransferase